MRPNPPIVLDKESQIIGGEIEPRSAEPLGEAEIAWDLTCSRRRPACAKRPRLGCGSNEVSDVIDPSAVGVCPKTLKQIDFGVVHMIDVKSEFEEMRIVVPGQGVRHLVPSFVR